jgi:hypothetical protein
MKDLEELCTAQQNSLEEGEEKYRALQDEQDQLHHTALAAKAQLVTAQAQVRAMFIFVSADVTMLLRVKHDCAAQLYVAGCEV